MPVESTMCTAMLMPAGMAAAITTATSSSVIDYQALYILLLRGVGAVPGATLMCSRQEHDGTSCAYQ